MSENPKKIIEALLFSSSQPLSLEKIGSAYPIKPLILIQIIETLNREYQEQDRPYRIEQIADGFMLQTDKQFSPYIEKFYEKRRDEPLSKASLEVLAIILHKQPITRTQIEAIRGIDSSSLVQHLLEKGLIEPSGKLDAPGKPTLWCTTQVFLTHFGLKSIEEARGSWSSQRLH